MATFLIVGGIGGDGPRQFLPFLLASERPPAFVRVVDKYMIITQATPMPSTTYLDPDVQTALRDPRVNYQQANLLGSQEARDKVFALPAEHGGPDKGFDFVFDFTGEADFELPDAVYIERTLRLAILLGQTAVASKAGVYGRALSHFYRVPDDKKAKVGAEGTSPAEPWGRRASWAHEAARSLALIPELKLVVFRCGLFYGDYTLTGLTPRLLIAEVYKFRGEKLEFLWAEGLTQNTIHVLDAAAGAAKAVEWVVNTPKEEQLGLAGEVLPSTLSSNDLIKDVPGAAKMEDIVRAVVFNLVDEGETTQADIAKAVSEAVGVQSGFHGTIISSFAKLNMKDVVEDVNELHLEGWSDLLTASNPPISSTVPISPHIPQDLLMPYPISFSTEKLKKLTAFEPRFKLTPDVLRRTVEQFKREQCWPVAPPKKKGKK